MKKIKSVVLIIMLAVTLTVLSGCAENTSNQVNKPNNTINKSANNASNNTSNQIDISKINFVGQAEKQVANPNKGETIAIMHIKDYGDIKIKFFKDIAPKAVENFVKLSQNGYYNGVTFHRVINDFMIQGGDPTATGRGGESVWGSPFQDEFDISLVPYRGALCMANSGSNTNGSQFFIEQAKYDEATYKALVNSEYPENLLEAYKKYGGSMHLFYRHTVFGQVIEGMDIVDKIAECKTDENDKPVNNVVIESIDITEY